MPNVKPRNRHPFVGRRNTVLAVKAGCYKVGRHHNPRNAEWVRKYTNLAKRAKPVKKPHGLQRYMMTLRAKNTRKRIVRKRMARRISR